MVGATIPVHNYSFILNASRLPSLFMTMDVVPTEVMGPKASVESSPPPLGQPLNSFSLPSATHSHPVGGRI